MNRNFCTILLLALVNTTTILAQQPFTINIEKHIDSLVQAYGDPAGPGIAVSVVHQGKIIYERQNGLSNLEYGVPISDSTVFHIASVSKQFTAFLILLLEEEGKLSVDDDIKKYLPELSDLPYKVTIRQLANHTHGFPNTYELAQLMGISSQDVMTQKQMIDILLRQRQLNFTPGTRYEYNNSGFALLAEIIQRITGKPFAQYAREKLFLPLGMNHSLFLDDNATIVKNKAYSYKKTQAGYAKVPFNYTVVGASGLNTTQHDLTLWAMNFSNPKIGSQKILDRMKPSSHLNNGQHIPYAFGQETKKHKGLDVIFHGGGDAGYRAYFLRIPGHDFSVILLGNFEAFNPLDLSYAIVDAYLKKYETIPPVKPLPQYSTADLKTWQGNYELFPGVFFTLVAGNDSLFYQPFGTTDKYPLPVEGDSSFTFPLAPHSRLVFGNEGLKWHFSDFSYACKKLSLKLPYQPETHLQTYTGIYWNEELRTSYKIMLQRDTLVATHAFNPDIILKPLAPDAFYAGKSYFGRIQFTRDKQQRVTGFSVSGQNLNNIRFIRLQ